MTQEENRFVSRVENVSAADGSTFDILRHVPEDAAKLRGDALVRMREVAQREPGLVDYMKTGSGTSAEYAMSSGVSHAENPVVKADLTRVAIAESLAEGDRWGAVAWLEYAKAPELSLDEFGEPWVLEQYEASLREGNPHDAWMIARLMTEKPEKVVKPDSSTLESGNENRDRWLAWQEREQHSFKLHAEAVLKEAEETIGGYNWRLENLFNTMRFREDGFSAVKPSELSRRVALAAIEHELVGGRGWVALAYAMDARMPADYIAQLRKRVHPSALDKFNKWLDGLRKSIADSFSSRPKQLA